MTTAQAVAQIINYVDNLSSSDGGNTDRESRTLYFLQETVNDIWYHRVWNIALANFSVSITANTSSATITGSSITFSDIPEIVKRSSVFSSTGSLVKVVPPGVIMAYQAISTDSEALPTICSPFGQSATTPYLPLMQTRKQSSAQTLTVYGRKRPAVLALSGTSNLEWIPEQWHQSVVIPGARAKAQKSKGDVKDWSVEYTNGLMAMERGEPQFQGFGLPGFFDGRVA